MSKKSPRVLLVTPPYHSGVVESAGTWMPLNFVYLAGHARQTGAEVRIYDAMSRFDSHEEIGKVIEEFRPDIVATTAITALEPDAREICKTAKNIDESITTVMGNVHPTFCWSEILSSDENVDVIVRGEGEATFSELIDVVRGERELGTVQGVAYLEGGVPFATSARPFAPDLDALVPAWDLIEWPIYSYRPSPEGQLAIVNSSRGCQQACSFCSQQKFWERSWRGRDPLRFVEELEHLRDNHNVRVAMLSDETPTVDEARWEKILDLMIERQVGVEILMETRVNDILRDEKILPKYVEAGISHIYVGIESSNQATLDEFKKDTTVEQSRRAIELINQHEMVSETSFVLGTLDETPESIERSLEIAKWYGPDMAFFLAITPWPYADIYPALKDHIKTTDYRRYNLVEPVVEPRNMTLEELHKALHHCTGHFFKDKFERLDELSPKKRTFMIAVLKLLIEKSYLGKEMHAMASGAQMPEKVKKMLGELGIDFPHGHPHGKP